LGKQVLQHEGEGESSEKANTRRKKKSQGYIRVCLSAHVKRRKKAEGPIRARFRSRKTTQPPTGLKSESDKKSGGWL